MTTYIDMIVLYHERSILLHNYNLTFKIFPNFSACGDIHSVKWYRGQERLFVYSPQANFRKAEGFLTDR
jgi:hypothetical protein